MIGSALVGTFMGVFLAYGFIGPFATRLTAIHDEECTFYKIIKDVMVAHLHGNAAQISVEIGRGGRSVRHAAEFCTTRRGCPARRPPKPLKPPKA